VLKTYEKQTQGIPVKNAAQEVLAVVSALAVASGECIVSPFLDFVLLFLDWELATM